MENVAILVAQIVTVMILLSLKKAGLLKDTKKGAWAVFGLEIMLVPPLLAITDITEPSELHPVTIVILLLVMFLGFLIFRKAISTRHSHG